MLLRVKKIIITVLIIIIYSHRTSPLFDWYLIILLDNRIYKYVHE